MGVGEYGMPCHDYSIDFLEPLRNINWTTADLSMGGLRRLKGC